MRRTEDIHHTPENVHGYVEQALVILDDFTLTPDERAHLPPQVVALLSSKQIFYEQVAPAGMLLPQNARH